MADIRNLQPRVIDQDPPEIPMADLEVRQTLMSIDASLKAITAILNYMAETDKQPDQYK